jgi:hypothetical protein
MAIDPGIVGWGSFGMGSDKYYLFLITYLKS